MSSYLEKLLSIADNVEINIKIEINPHIFWNQSPKEYIRRYIESGNGFRSHKSLSEVEVEINERCEQENRVTFISFCKNKEPLPDVSGMPVIPKNYFTTYNTNVENSAKDMLEILLKDGVIENV